MAQGTHAGSQDHRESGTAEQLNTHTAVVGIQSMLGGESKALFGSRGRRIIDWAHSALWSWAVHSLFDHTQQPQMVIRGRIVVAVVASCDIYFS